MGTALSLEKLYSDFLAAFNYGIDFLGAAPEDATYPRGPADRYGNIRSCRYCGGDLLTILNSCINITHAAVPAVPGVLVTSYRISKRPLSTV